MSEGDSVAIDESPETSNENATSSGAFGKIMANTGMAILMPILVGLLLIFVGKVKTFKQFHESKKQWPMILIFIGMFFSGYYISNSSVKENKTCSDTPQCATTHTQHGLFMGLFGLLVYQLVFNGTYQSYKRFETDYEKIDYILEGKKVTMDETTCDKTMEKLLDMMRGLISPFATSVKAAKDDCGVYIKKCKKGLFSFVYAGDKNFKNDKVLEIVKEDEKEVIYKCYTDLKIERGSVMFFFLVLVFYLIVIPMPLIAIIYFRALKMCGV